MEKSEQSDWWNRGERTKNGRWRSTVETASREGAVKKRDALEAELESARELFLFHLTLHLKITFALRVLHWSAAERSSAVGVESEPEKGRCERRVNRMSSTGFHATLNTFECAAYESCAALAAAESEREIRSEWKGEKHEHRIAFRPNPLLSTRSIDECDKKNTYCDLHRTKFISRTDAVAQKADDSSFAYGSWSTFGFKTFIYLSFSVLSTASTWTCLCRAQPTRNSIIFYSDPTITKAAAKKARTFWLSACSWFNLRGNISEIGAREREESIRHRSHCVITCTRTRTRTCWWH